MKNNILFMMLQYINLLAKN